MKNDHTKSLKTVKEIHFIWFGIGFSLFYWVMEAVRDAFIFNKGSILEQIFFPGHLSFWTRFLVIGVIILFSIRSQTIRKKIQEDVNQETQTISTIRIVRVGIGFSILYWALESFRDVFSFGRGSFIERLFTPDPMTIWVRLLIIFIILLFSVYAQSIINTQKLIEITLRKKQDKMKKEVEKQIQETTKFKSSFNFEKMKREEIEEELKRAHEELSAIYKHNKTSVYSDSTKNRIYLEMRGNLDKNDVFSLRHSFKNAAFGCELNFDIVMNVIKLGDCSPKIYQLLCEILHFGIKHGAHHVVLVEGDIIEKTKQIQHFFQQYVDFPIKHFKSLEEADAFLDVQLKTPVSG